MKIDIQKDEAEITFEEKVGRAVDGLAAVEGISRENAEKLVQGGFLSIDGILAADAADLADAADISVEDAAAISEAAAALQDTTE